MASDYVQDLAFRQISHAIMATANSVVNNAAASSSDGGSGESSIFDVVRRKWGKVQDVIQGIAAPLKRRSTYDELPEHVWPPENIEMSHLVQPGRGHNFLPCQLSNPTWCDYCGDFIWGLYKQCLRCQTCQYTCHQHCVPAVTLDCKSISEDGVALIPARTPSPSDPRSNLETSLSIGNIYARPGSARSVSSGAGSNADTTSVASRSGSQPNVQHLVQGSPRGCNDPYLVTSSAAGHHGHVPSSSNPATPKHLSRSVSEGFVTANSSPAPVQNLTPHPVVAQGQHISPPPCSSAGSHQQTHSQTHSTGQSPSQLQQPVSSGDHVATKASHTDNTVNTSNRPEAVAAVADISHLHRPDGDANQEPGTEKDETDSGYRSGTIPDDQLPRVPSQATLDRQELKRKIAKFNHFVPAASLDATGKESFQGFLKVTMNLIRPITMELGARPPSIYELLTREHIIEENTQQVAFYMPRDTHKSLHITSDTTTKEVVTSLLKKFHILDHPRKFAMYEQEFSDRNKLVRLRRLNDKDFPLRAILSWDPERIKNYRVVLQENETGEIVWDAFSLPELNNFMKVLDREEKETILELKHKYAYMKQYMERRISELKNERHKQAKSKK